MEKTDLEIDGIYTTKQIQEFMGVRQSTWSHKRDKLLENFSLYYEYECLYEGRCVNYHILQKFGDYQKPLPKRNSQKRDKVYEEKIVDVIQEDNLQTAKNVARIIQNTEEIQQFHHTEGKIYENTRLRMRSMFGKRIREGGTHGAILEKVWCRLDAEHNCYIPMKEEEIQKFHDCLGEMWKTSSQTEADLYNDFQIGLITKEELAQTVKDIGLSNFLVAKEIFYASYGYHPVKVPLYGIKDKDYYDFSGES